MDILSFLLGYKKGKSQSASGENKLAQFVEGTLTEITAEDLEGITEIGRYGCYGNGGLISVHIPSHIQTIGYCGFSNCSNLATITLDEGIKSIEQEAFYKCGFTSVIIPDSVTYTSMSTFGGCPNLISVKIGSGLKTLSPSMFISCSSLINLTIPATIIDISTYALRIANGTNKATITFLGTTPPSVQSNSFRVEYLEKIIVPAGCGEAYRTATNWANFADYIEEASV